jgi:hypothetical protein
MMKKQSKDHNAQWNKRRQKLQQELERKVRELFEHMGSPASISIPLGDKLWVTIGPRPSGEE